MTPDLRDDGELIAQVIMVEAWLMDDTTDDQRLPHRQSPNVPVSLDELAAIGVAYWKLDADKFESDPELEHIRAERKYDYHDIITVSPEKLENYETKIKSFFEEHIHSDEEIRYVRRWLLLCNTS